VGGDDAGGEVVGGRRTWCRGCVSRISRKNEVDQPTNHRARHRFTWKTLSLRTEKPRALARRNLQYMWSVYRTPSVDGGLQEFTLRGDVQITALHCLRCAELFFNGAPRFLEKRALRDCYCYCYAASFKVKFPPCDCVCCPFLRRCTSHKEKDRQNMMCYCSIEK
jgi:hypothetical protein